eukprot:scaffold30889_cov75-Phaeocystis_antarctica.AAC.3
MLKTTVYMLREDNRLKLGLQKLRCDLYQLALTLTRGSNILGEASQNVMLQIDRVVKEERPSSPVPHPTATCSVHPSRVIAHALMRI